MHTIKLPTTTLDNLELNGNNYISEQLIDNSVFSDLSIVEIDGIEYKNMKLIQNIIYEGKSWFVLAEKKQSDLDREHMDQLRADTDYISIMAGVEL